MGRQFEKVLLEYGWAKVSNWECSIVNKEKGLFLSVCVDDIKMAGKKQNLDPMWKRVMKDVDLEEPTSFLDHVDLGCNENAKQAKILWTIKGIRPVTWKVMQRNAWEDIANLRTKQPNSNTKSQHHALTTTNSKKKT